jgi:hypothetical protein
MTKTAFFMRIPPTYNADFFIQLLDIMHQIGSAIEMTGSLIDREKGKS